MTSILLVEDEPDLLLLYGRLLAREGYAVTAARDGIETIGRLLSMDNTLPVILHTAHSTCRHDYRSWSAGAFVSKDEGLDALLAAVRDVLGFRAVQPRE